MMNSTSQPYPPSTQVTIVGNMPIIDSLSSFLFSFLADRTNGRATATLLCLSVVCDVMYCG